MRRLTRASVKPATRWCSAPKLALICVLAGVAVQAQPSPPTALPRYTYMIGKIRITGMSDTDNDRIRLRMQLRERLGSAIVDLGVSCPDKVPTCDLIAIDQVENQQFEVQFSPNALNENNTAHAPQFTRQMQVLNQRTVWTLASRDIVDMIQKHHLTHTQLEHGGAER